MEAKSHIASLTLLVLALCVGTCHAAADDAYWNDQKWDGKLLDAVQSALRYPMDSTGQPVQPIAKTAQATVSFIYSAGKIAGPKIVESSGRADLDAAFLTEVVNATPPTAQGSHAAEPHAFELVLEMPTPFQQFEIAEYQAIIEKRVYPRRAILNGVQGSNTVRFKYLDGTVTDIQIINPSGDKTLDEASLRAVKSADMPPVPTWIQHKPLYMTLSFCYSLHNSNLCPQTREALQISEASPVNQPATPSSGP